jgi:hypothetical protein
MAHRLGFYDVCDHLSRLTQTLEERKYHVPIYTPATDVEVAKRIKDGWEKPHFSNPRTTRMRLDKDENIYLSGWSATATSKESWWSPFIWKLNPADGTIIRKIVETDPMSGGDNRMGGAVADRAIGSLAVDTNRLYYNSLSDGGWSGVIHFSGTIFKLDSAAGKETAKARTGPCYWCVDMAALPGDRLLALGRCNKVRDWPEKAWQKADGGQNPEAWLSLYNGAMQPEFTTAIRGVLPHSLCELGDGRYMVVGQSKGSLQKIVPKENKSVEVLEEPNPSVALLKDPLMDKPRGDDGYFMIVRDAAGR